MTELGIGEKQGPWHVVEYALSPFGSEECLPLGRLDWADWCPSGDLLYAKEGCIWRLPLAKSSEPDLRQANRLVDLRSLRFAELQTPPEALTWDNPVPVPPPLSSL